jgi:hypothetical protein
MTRALLAVAAAALLAPLAAQAQVVREDGVKSIAGVVSLAASSAAWTFKSSGGEILFATLDADIYKESVEHEHATAAAAAAENEEEGGPGMFRLVVLDQSGNPVCTARRPTPPPGWQRDPRMACVLSSAQTYSVRVELVAGERVTAKPYPFLLNLSLRKIAKSGTNVQSAIAASATGSF